jgi:ATP-binding cassette subfamily B protein
MHGLCAKSLFLLDMALFSKKFPAYHQLDMMDCGPTCIRMIAKYYGKSISIQYLREKSFIEKDGVSLSGLAVAAETIGMRPTAVEAHYKALCEEATLPCVAFWRQNHFIVIYKIKNDIVYVADPAVGFTTKYTKEEFLKYWISGRSEGEDVGILLLLEPTPDFYAFDEDEKGAAPPKKFNLAYLFKYFIPYKKYLWQLLFGLFATSIITLIFPFLTQSLIDFGVNNQNLRFIYAVLLSQLFLFIGGASIDIIRRWILLNISIRMNISLVSDFLAKLMRLSLGFFDSKNIGDIIERIRDHERIEHFFTSATFDVVFGLFNILIFGIVLAFYDVGILLVFLAGTLFYVLWVLLFWKKRRDMDYKLFNRKSANNISEVELVRGMQEIKLNNCEYEKRWQWEGIQAQIFKIKQKGLAFEQYQTIGANLINQLKNILITFMAATAVLKGEITLGMMLAISFIIGQLNAPIEKLTDIIKLGQDASLSLERLGEIHSMKNEDESLQQSFLIPEKEDIVVKDLYFRYGNPYNPWVLNNINLTIPRGKTTAIVGASGSGKTTLVKLLLKFYPPEKGEINIGNMPLSSLHGKVWRDNCGAVMQDGYIFADTVARNIAVTGNNIDKRKLLHSAELACVRDFIESMPMNYNSMIGLAGVSISGGQKQRILIARAIYKDPEFLFFDEATSALDAKNEMEITRNLAEFTKNKTTIVVAHRLSTVKSADKIIVLDKGQVVEEGTHEELTRIKGIYYNLVKNQLELGS